MRVGGDRVVTASPGQPECEKHGALFWKLTMSRENGDKLLVWKGKKWNEYIYVEMTCICQ